MKILGLDSSGLVASVAIIENGTLLAEYSTNYKKTHSQTLLPMLEEIKNMVELDLNTIDAIAISQGPGSFTGLRIGAATAKGLGLALEKPLVEVPTLAGLAFNLWGTDAYVCPIMDARRNQVYTGIYAFENVTGEETENAETGKNQNDKTLGSESQAADYRLTEILPQCAIDIKELMEQINRLGKKVIFLGDGVPVFRETIKSSCTAPFSFAPASHNYQRAISVAALGEQYYLEGKTVSAAEHQPEYLRKSQAEREREEAQSGK